MTQELAYWQNVHKMQVVESKLEAMLTHSEKEHHVDWLDRRATALYNAAEEITTVIWNLKQANLDVPKELEKSVKLLEQAADEIDKEKARAAAAFGIALYD